MQQNISEHYKLIAIWKTCLSVGDYFLFACYFKVDVTAVM